MSRKNKEKHCRYCGEQINLHTNRCPVCGKKQKRSGLIIVLIIVIVLIIGFFALLLSPAPDTEPTEVVYVDETDINKVYSDPDAYAGKYLKITGQIFNLEEYDDYVYMQIFQDCVNYENNTLIEYQTDSPSDFELDDYVLIDGYIKGAENFTTVLGVDTSAPLIVAKDIQKITYMDAVAPTIKTIEIEKTIEKDGYALTLNKVEFAATETRCYFTLANNGNEIFSLSDGIAIQDSKQYEEIYVFEDGYESIPYDLHAGAEASGIVVFDAMDSEKEFIIKMEGYDNTYYDSYYFEYTVQ